MTRAQATSRSIFLPGVLAAAVVALALALLAVAPGPAAEDGPPALPTASLAGEATPPSAGRPEPPPAHKALRQSHAPDHGVGSRHAGPGVLLVPRRGPTVAELPPSLAPFRGRRPAATRPLLHVLFCTWLA
jgi:hypothetical protein